MKELAGLRVGRRERTNSADGLKEPAWLRVGRRERTAWLRVG